MLVLPIQTRDHINDAVIVILEKEHWDKISQANPVQISLADMVAQTGKHVYLPTILICYESDVVKVMQFLQKKDIIGALKYLTRGAKAASTDPVQQALLKLAKTIDC